MLDLLHFAPQLASLHPSHSTTTAHSSVSFNVSWEHVPGGEQYTPPIPPGAGPWPSAQAGSHPEAAGVVHGDAVCCAGVEGLQVG